MIDFVIILKNATDKANRKYEESGFLNYLVINMGFKNVTGKFTNGKIAFLKF